MDILRESPFRLEEAPLDIKLLITSKLTVRDLASLWICSKTLSQLSRLPKVWNTLIKRDFPKYKTKSSKESLKNIYEELSRPCWSTSIKSSSIQLSEDCLTVSKIGEGVLPAGVRATHGFSRGKHYWEIEINKIPPQRELPDRDYLMIGVAGRVFHFDHKPVGNLRNGLGFSSMGTLIYWNDTIYNKHQTHAILKEGDVVGVLVDCDKQFLQIYVNKVPVIDPDHYLDSSFQKYISHFFRRYAKTKALYPAVSLPNNETVITANFKARLNENGESIGFYGSSKSM